MSNLHGNLDYNSAISLLQKHQPEKFQSDDLAQLADCMNANTLATLALSREQRAANLIAIYRNGFPESALSDENWANVRRQIADFLGIGQA